jgi:hypothetical protein
MQFSLKDHFRVGEDVKFREKGISVIIPFRYCNDPDRLFLSQEDLCKVGFTGATGYKWAVG